MSQSSGGGLAAGATWWLSSVNLTLRAVSLGGKFLLVLYLARVFSPAALGQYGIFAATLALALQVLGLEFHVYAARELVRRPTEQWPALVRNQAALLIPVFFLTLPPLLGVFASGMLPWAVAPWFFAVLALEHSCQEIQRVLNTLERPVQATLVLFLRSGAWCLVALAIMQWRPEARGLSLVWAAWLAGVGGGLVLAVLSLRDLPWRAGLRTPLDWTWVRRGVVAALPFLLASLSVRAMASVDRFFLQHFHGPALTGAYVFYSGITTALTAAVDASVVTILVPGLLRAGAEGATEAFEAQLRRLARALLVVVPALALLAGAVTLLVLRFLPHALYAQQLPAFWLLLIGTALSALGLIPHYALYARHGDRIIIGSTMVGLLVVLLVDVLWTAEGGAVAVASAFVAGSVVTGALKLWGLSRVSRGAQRPS